VAAANIELPRFIEVIQKVGVLYSHTQFAVILLDFVKANSKWLVIAFDELERQAFQFVFKNALYST